MGIDSNVSAFKTSDKHATRGLNFSTLYATATFCLKIVLKYEMELLRRSLSTKMSYWTFLHWENKQTNEANKHQWWTPDLEWSKRVREEVEKKSRNRRRREERKWGEKRRGRRGEGGGEERSFKINHTCSENPNQSMNERKNCQEVRDYSQIKSTAFDYTLV